MPRKWICSRVWNIFLEILELLIKGCIRKGLFFTTLNEVTSGWTKSTIFHRPYSPTIYIAHRSEQHAFLLLLGISFWERIEKGV